MTRFARSLVLLSMAVVASYSCGGDRSPDPIQDVIEVTPDVEPADVEPTLEDVVIPVDLPPEVEVVTIDSGYEVDTYVEPPLFVPVAATADPAWLTTPPQCQPEDWMGKYFNYRLRFRGNDTAEFPGFVSVGERQGESLVAAFRDPTLDCSDSGYMTGCSLATTSLGNGSYAWEDLGTHGLYLSLLATEYAMFTRLGLDTNETVADLRHALNAINRLDVAANAYYGVLETAAALDGFYQQNDLTLAFIFEDMVESDWRFPRDDPWDGYGCIESILNCGAADVGNIDSRFFGGKYQTMALLTGLAMVSKLVPDDVTVEGMGLRHEARTITDRLVRWVKAQDWHVEDPSGTEMPDDFGGNARSFSDPMAKCANLVCGTDFGMDDYRDGTTKGVGGTGLPGVDVAWGNESERNKFLAYNAAACADEWKDNTWVTHARNEGTMAYAFMNAILHDKPVPADLLTWETESFLTSAPCTGPCHNTPGCEEVPGWQGSNRLRQFHKANGNLDRPVGEFSGLDYLLTHNLYFLARDGSFGYEIQEPPASGCDHFVGLDHLIAEGVAAPMSYDPRDPCAASDMERVFCGRRFNAWLEAAYRGEAGIYTGRGTWACVGKEPCTITIPPHPGNGLVTQDLMLGTEGDDDLDGWDGDDCIYGFGGNDTLTGGQDRDEIHGGPGHDVMAGEGTSMIVTGANDTLFGDEGDDTIEGDPGEDQIFGGLGHDHLMGDSGNDWIEGADGNDLIWGDSGEDTIIAGAGNDRIDGDSGHDRIYGDDGNDFIRGSSDDDLLYAGPGVDTLCGCSGDDTLVGTGDGDACRGGSCSLLGSSGTDTLYSCSVDLDSDGSYTDCNDDIDLSR